MITNTITIDGRSTWRADYAQDISRSEKKCRRCNQVKSSSEFYTLNSRKRGKILGCYCRECWTEKQRARARDNPEKTKQYRAEYYRKNRERVIGYSKKWHNDPENRKITTAKMMQRLKTNEVAHFKHITRVRIRKILNGERTGAKGRMVFLLGCTGEQALKILTNGSMLLPKDHHVDHHIPCSYFDFKNESHQRICFNWRNLRLMAAVKNMEKHDTLPLNHIEVESEIRSALSIDSASL